MRLFIYFVGLLLLIALPSNALFAQDRVKYLLKGIVTDGKTNLPLSGATLAYDGNPNLLRTDQNGVFEVRMWEGNRVIKIDYVGYQTISTLVELYADTLIRFEMQTYASQLEEVIISSQQERRNIESSALGVSQLSLKSVKKLPAVAGEVDILRSLQTLPGISSVGEGSNGINIRGGNVDQNLIYFDEMPIINPTHMFGYFSVLATDAIREFQIYKGSIPAQYGGRTSSVLDIKMKNPDAETFKLDGGIGFISNRLTMEIPLIKDKLSILTSGRVSYNNYLINFYNNVISKGLGTDYINGNNASFYDFANKIYYRPNSKNILSLSAYHSNDRFEAFDLYGIQNVISRKTRFRYGHRNYAAHWTNFIKQDLILNTSLVSTQYYTQTNTLDSLNKARLVTNYLYRQFKSDLNYAPEKKYRVGGGLSAIRYDIRPGELLPDDELSGIFPVLLEKEQSWELAAYANGEYHLGARTLLEGGIRYARYLNVGALSQPLYGTDGPRTPNTVYDTLVLSKGAVESSYGGFEPRVAIRYKLNELVSIKVGYNRMQQFVQLLSNSTTPLPTARWKTANRYIKPQQSNFLTAGFFQNFKSGFWEYSVEAYYRANNNVLDFTSSADLQLNTLVETQLISGKSKSYGLEFMLSKKKGRLTGWANYTYGRSLQQMRGAFPALEQINNGNWYPSYVDKPHTVNCLMTLKSDEHNSISLTFTYSTGRPYTAPVGAFVNGNNFVPIFTDRNNRRISDYHRLDFSWTITNPRMINRRFKTDWVFAIYNVYGRKNAYSYFFKPVASGVQPYKLSVFAFPIISLTCNFKFQ